MRVFLTAMAFSMLSFLAGVAGDLSSVTAPAMAAAQPVVMTLPPAEFTPAPIATAEPIAAAPTLTLAATPTAKADKLCFAAAAEEQVEVELLAKAKAA